MTANAPAHDAAAIAEIAAEDERGAVAWQPIETCPDDGRAFIVWSKSSNLQIAYGPKQDGSFGAATHWMRPAAPDALPATDQAAEVERLRADIANLHDLDGSATCDECGAPLFDSDETDTDEAEVLALCAGHVRPGEPIYSYRVAATDQAAEVERLREALFSTLHALERIRDLTPSRANASDADDFHGSIKAVAETAMDRFAEALAPQPATGRTMGGEDGLRKALEDIETMLTPNGNVWTGTEPKWQTDAYARARAALQNGGE